MNMTNPGSVNTSQYYVTRIPISGDAPMKMRAVIKEEAKAGSTLIKEVRARIMPEGPRDKDVPTVDLIK